MTDRTVPTEPTWKLVPTEPTPEIETRSQEFARLVRDYQNGEAQLQNEAWNLIADFAVENAEFIRDALLAYVAASPAAPGAEVEPVAWEWETFTGGCWERQSSRAKPDLERWIDPTRSLRPLFASPPTTAAIKAQARREALEDAARIVDAECKRILSQQDGLIPEVDTQLRMIALLLPDIAVSIRALAGKPGEAE